MIKTINQPREVKTLLEMTESKYQVILKYNPPTNLKMVVAVLPYNLSGKDRAVILRITEDLSVNNWMTSEDFTNKNVPINPSDSREEKIRKYFSWRTPHSLLEKGDIVILVSKRMSNVVSNKDYAAALVAAAYCQEMKVPIIGGNLLLTIMAVATRKVHMNQKAANKQVKRVIHDFYRADKSALLSFEDDNDEISEDEIAELANEPIEPAEANEPIEQPAEPEDDYLDKLLRDLKKVIPNPTAEDLVNYVTKKVFERTAEDAEVKKKTTT